MIEYLRAENAVLWEKHGEKRILLNDDQRRRLAVIDPGKEIGCGEGEVVRDERLRGLLWYYRREA